MAKGSGTVGRKPGDPPTYGPPIIFKPPKGGYGPKKPRKGKTGIPVKAQPRPEMEWYENDQRPVKASDRIYHTEDGPNAETYREATKRIDKVHAVKAGQNPTQWSAQYAPGSEVLGTHSGHVYIDVEPGPDQGKIREYSNVVLNKGYNTDNEPAKRGTLYHEQGHAHDRQQNFEKQVIPNTYSNDSYHLRKYDSENAFRIVETSGGSLEPDPGDTPTVQWAKSVQRSKSYKSLVEKREKAKKDGTNRGLIDYLDYLTDPKELYARSYAQFIARNADPEAEKSMRETYRERDDDFKKFVGYDQWRGKDFDSINASFNRIYGSRGLDVQNIKHDPRVPIEV